MIDILSQCFHVFVNLCVLTSFKYHEQQFYVIIIDSVFSYDIHFDTIFIFPIHFSFAEIFQLMQIQYISMLRVTYRLEKYHKWFN